MKKISMHQTNELISGGKRLAWLFPAAIAFMTIVSWASGVYASQFLVRYIVEAATPDEHEKGWLIIKPKLLLSRLFTFQVLLLV